MSALIERNASARHSIALEAVDATHRAAARKRLTAPQRRALDDSGFVANPGTFALINDASGKLVRVLAGVTAGDSFGALSGLPLTLPEATYHLADESVHCRRRWDGPSAPTSSPAIGRPNAPRPRSP